MLNPQVQRWALFAHLLVFLPCPKPKPTVDLLCSRLSNASSSARRTASGQSSNKYHCKVAPGGGGGMGRTMMMIMMMMMVTRREMPMLFCAMKVGNHEDL